MAAILLVLSRILKSIELKARYRSFLNGISLPLSYSCRGCFSDIFRHSFTSTVHDTLLWLQKFGKQLHLLSCVSNAECLLVAESRNSVRPLGVTYWPDNHLLLSFPYNYTYPKMVMMRYVTNLLQGFLQRIQIFNSLCFTSTFVSNPILSNPCFSYMTHSVEWTAANFKSFKLSGMAI